MGLDATDTVIIGAGIAGLATAYAFVEAGMPVTVLEREKGWLEHASGNRAAVFSPYYLSKSNATSQFLADAFEYAADFYGQLSESPGSALVRTTGITHLPATARLARMLLEAKAGAYRESEIRYVSKGQSQEVCGVALPSESLHLPRGGWLIPDEIATRLSARTGSRLQVHYQTKVTGLTQVYGGWRIAVCKHNSVNTEIFAKRVVIANAWEAREFPLTASLPLEPVRGAVMNVIPCGEVAPLATVLCHSGYIVPLSPSLHLLGATYRHGATGEVTTTDEEAALLAQVNKWLPHARPTPMELRVRYRASTPSRLPIVQPIAGTSNLFVNVGHGSRGFVTAPLAGLLVREMALMGKIRYEQLLWK